MRKQQVTRCPALGPISHPVPRLPGTTPVDPQPVEVRYSPKLATGRILD
jgi:hypothetical protein